PPAPPSGRPQREPRRPMHTAEGVDVIYQASWADPHHWVLALDLVGRPAVQPPPGAPASTSPSPKLRRPLDDVASSGSRDAPPRAAALGAAFIAPSAPLLAIRPGDN